VKKGKALCKRPFALHRYQPEKYKQNIDVAPLEKLLWMPIDRVLGQARNQGGHLGHLPSPETFQIIA